jgi:hypothetical protein
MIVEEKTVVENLEKSLGKTNWKRGKDKFTQGLQLQSGYLEHWDVIKDASKYYGVHMNRIGPVITKQAYDQIKIAREITEEIKNDQQLRDFAEKCNFPIRSVFFDGDDHEKIIDGIIFLMVFRMLTDFSVSFSKDIFISFMKNGQSVDCIKKLFDMKGVTIKETEKDVGNVVTKMIEIVKKKSYKAKELLSSGEKDE